MQTATELMSQGVKLISPDESIKVAAQHMLNGDFGILPVTENDRMIGAMATCTELISVAPKQPRDPRDRCQNQHG